MAVQMSLKSRVSMLSCGLLLLTVMVSIGGLPVAYGEPEIKPATVKSPAPVAESRADTAAPTLRRDSGQPAPSALVHKITGANQPWLQPRAEGLSYAFSMEHPGRGDRWEMSVEFTGRDRVILRSNRRGPYEGRVNNAYDPGNSAYPPRLLTLQQGVTFFGPLQEWIMSPKDISVWLAGEAKLDGVNVQILHLKTAGKQSEQTVRRWDQHLHRRATRPEFLYEFTPVEREIQGVKKAVMEIKSVYKEGPGWPDIVAAHAKNPAEIRWGGRVITAAIRDFHGQMRPMIVISPDPQFQGKSPITTTIFESGIDNRTTKLGLGEGKSIFDAELYKKLQAETPAPQRMLPMRIGCGIWGIWYGYSGGGVDVDQVWIDPATGFVLREEGFSKGQCQFIAQYSDFHRFPDGGGAPQRAVVSLLPREPTDAWVFDMRFAIIGGKAWLLKDLAESQGARKAVATAKISNAKVSAADDAPPKAVRSADGTPMAGPVRCYTGHTDRILDVTFSPDGKQAASCGRDRTVRLWDLTTGKEIRRLEGFGDRVDRVVFTPDGTQLLSASRDATVRLWDVASGKEVRRFQGHAKHVRSVAVSKDGRLVLSGGEDRTVRLWELATGRELKRISQGWPVFDVAISPDSALALSADPVEGTARLWDLKSGELVRRFDHQSRVSAVTFSPDGRLALCGGGPEYGDGDDSVRVWEVATGREMSRFTGHTKEVWKLAVSRDGSRVLSAGGEGVVRLWATAIGREICRFEGCTLNGAAFSPDSRLALTILGGDKTVCLWQLPEASAPERKTPNRE